MLLRVVTALSMNLKLPVVFDIYNRGCMKNLNDGNKCFSIVWERDIYQNMWPKLSQLYTEMLLNQLSNNLLIKLMNDSRINVIYNNQ